MLDRLTSLSDRRTRRALASSDVQDREATIARDTPPGEYAALTYDDADDLIVMCPYDTHGGSQQRPMKDDAAVVRTTNLGTPYIAMWWAL